MFIDDLALVEVLLLFGAVVLTYVGVTAWWAIRHNEPDKVRAALKGGAVPTGLVGGSALVLGLWMEMTWPYPSTMGGYNILFNDVVLIFGLVLVALAASAYFGLRLQYAGLFAFVAGAATLFYGWTGYGFGYTKEPLDFMLLYAGFGVAGIVALPATVLTDYYLGTVATSTTSWRATVPSTVGKARGLSARFGEQAVQGIGNPPPSSRTESTGAAATALSYRVPRMVHVAFLLFPVFMALAAFAAMWFFGTTLPGHLTPGKTP